MKRVFAFVLAAALSSTAVAATDPRTIPSQLSPAWQAKTRALFKQAIEIPSVHHRGETPASPKLLAGQFRAAGIRMPTSTSCPTRRFPATRRWR